MAHQLSISGFLLLAQNNTGAIWTVAPLVLIFVLFWMMLIRPEKRKQAEHQEMLKNLKKNDHIVTAGGIFGHVMSVSQDSDEVQLRIDENNNVRIKIRRSAIAHVLGDKGESENP